MIIRDIMSTDVIYVDKNESLEHVLYIMEKNNITKVPVVENGKPIGIITDGEIAYKLGSFRKRDVTPSHMHASSVMLKRYSNTTPDTPIGEILKTVGLPGPTMLLVIENKKLVGVLTKADLLPLVKDNRSVKSIMTKNVITVSPDDRIIHARRVLIDNNIARLPVISNGNVLGVIAEMDIVKALAEVKRSISFGHQKHQIEEILVRNAMNSPAITISPNSRISNAADTMLKQNVGGLPVVNGRLVGIITRTDLIRTIKLS